MAYPRIPRADAKIFMVKIDDISTADQEYFAPGFTGKITNISTCIAGTIATADADITVKISGTAVSNGVVTVTASGSTAGDVDSVTPTGNNFFSASDHIEVETDGASTNTVHCWVTIEVVPG